MTLTLLGAKPGDPVLLAFVAGFGVPPAGAALATHEGPRVTVLIEDGGGCPPPVAVAGLTVEGQLAYVLEFA